MCNFKKNNLDSLVSGEKLQCWTNQTILTTCWIGFISPHTTVEGLFEKEENAVFCTGTYEDLILISFYRGTIERIQTGNITRSGWFYQGILKPLSTSTVY